MARNFLQQSRGNQKGFTLVETMVVVVIYALVVYALFQSILMFYKFNAYAIAQSYQVDTARRGMDIMVRDIREMTFADDGTFPLALMAKNKIGFFSDIDRDNSVEYVEYELSTTTLLKKRVYGAVGNPPVYSLTPEKTEILSEYVQNLNQATSTFYYYDQNGVIANASSTVTDIAYITAQIIVNVDPLRDPGQFMLKGSGALRNLKETF
jgi:prepilin-type N-terminal cleavage/methylation domain-containing protein